MGNNYHSFISAISVRYAAYNCAVSVYQMAHDYAISMCVLVVDMLVGYMTPISVGFIQSVSGWRAYFIRVTLVMVANLTSGTITKVEFHIGYRCSFTKLVVIP